MCSADCSACTSITLTTCRCGDGVCNAKCNENAQTCPQDCQTCTPQCDGKECGPDGCNGYCGTCVDPMTCDPDTNQCVCPGGSLRVGDACVECSSAPSPESVACGETRNGTDCNGDAWSVVGTGCGEGAACVSGACTACSDAPSPASVACGETAEGVDCNGASWSVTGTHCEEGACVDGACCPDVNGDGVCDACTTNAECPGGKCVDGACCTPTCPDPASVDCGATASDGCGGTCPGRGTRCGEGETCVHDACVACSSAPASVACGETAEGVDCTGRPWSVEGDACGAGEVCTPQGCRAASVTLSADPADVVVEEGARFDIAITASPAPGVVTADGPLKGTDAMRAAGGTGLSGTLASKKNLKGGSKHGPRIDDPRDIIS